MRIDPAAMTTLSVPRFEQNQSQTLESLAGVILVTLDMEGCIEQINGRGCIFLGFTSQELIGQNWFACCAPEPERQQAEYTSLLASVAEFPEHLLGRVQTRSGEVHSIFWHSMLRKDSRGRVQGVLRSGIDLSASGTALASLVGDLAKYHEAQQELARRQAEINRARKQLAFASRMSTLGEIATGIAHEVNQPLAAIASYAKAGSRLLENGNLSMDEVRELLDKISVQAQRAGTVVHKVRSQISPPDKKHRCINMNTLLRDTLDLLDVVNDAADTKIELDLASELPAVEMDIIDLQQVALSLIRNAIEAMRDNESVPKILRLCTRVVEPNSVLVSITDNGSGIMRQHASSIYEPFFTTRKDSMGMGLAISRSIISAYDGVLRHCPAKPRGSKFYFAVPAIVRHD
ncbi:MAG: PAS domain-containing sensor histidine kinase [Pseudomonadales bacterium]